MHGDLLYKNITTHLTKAVKQLLVLQNVSYTFPTVAKYSPSGDHLAMWTDAAVLSETQAKKTISATFTSLWETLQPKTQVVILPSIYC